MNKIITEKAQQILYYIALIVLLILLYNISLLFIDIIIIIFAVFFLNILLRPVVDYLKIKLKLSETISSFLIILVLSFMIITILNILIPSIYISIKEISEKINKNLYFFLVSISNSLNNIFSSIGIKTNIQSDQLYKVLVDQISKNIPSITEKTFSIILYSTKTIFNILLIIVLTFYTIKDYHLIKNFQTNLISKVFNLSSQQVGETITKIENILRKFFLCQLVAATYIFTFTFISLYIFQVEQFLVIATLAGLFELIPFIGAFISFTLSVIFIINKGITSTLIFIVIAIIAYQILAKVIYPYFAGKILKLSVITIIISLMMGYKLYGIFGMVIAIPLVSTLKVILFNFEE